MSFEYNAVNFDKVESVRLTGGEISPKASTSDEGSDSLTSEQKRKRQLVRLLENDFEEFHDFLDELIVSYRGVGRQREFVSEMLGVPEYEQCKNCVNLGESKEGEPICMKTRHKEEGQTLYNTIPDIESIPRFCSRDMRDMRFPEDRLDEVADWLVRVAERGYEPWVENRREEYKERRQQAIEEGREHSKYVTEDIDDLIQSKKEYTARGLDKLVRSLFHPHGYEDYRRSAMRLAWLYHLDDVLQEEYYHQRGEAYLRALDSPHRSEKTPGEGGDEFEQECREWLQSWGFPMLDRVFELEGVRANHKEMDIHTEFPTGERVIFEVFTRGAHSNKHQQLSDYGRLLELAEGVEAVQILLSDYSLSRQVVSEGLLYRLLSLDVEQNPERQPPGRAHNPSFPNREHDLLGTADSLSYSGYEPDHEPRDSSQESESKITAKLRSSGYEPTFPVYNRCGKYGFCGPTIELGEGENRLSLTFHSDRDQPWNDDGSRNKRMYKNANRERYDWIMDGTRGWHSALSEIKECPVGIVEVKDTTQSSLHPLVFHRLLQEIETKH